MTMRSGPGLSADSSPADLPGASSQFKQPEKCWNHVDDPCCELALDRSNKCRFLLRGGRHACMRCACSSSKFSKTVRGQSIQSRGKGSSAKKCVNCQRSAKREIADRDFFLTSAGMFTLQWASLAHASLEVEADHGQWVSDCFVQVGLFCVERPREVQSRSPQARRRLSKSEQRASSPLGAK